MKFVGCVFALTLLGRIYGRFNYSDGGKLASTSAPKEKNATGHSLYLRSHLKDEQDVRDILISKFKTLSANKVTTVFSTMWSNSFTFSSRPNASLSRCVRDIRKVWDGARNGEAWSIPFIDSSAKPGPSITEGWLNWAGNYDQCKDAVAPSDGDGGVGGRNSSSGFEGKYCVLSFFDDKNALGFEASFGLCFPETCSEIEIESMADNMIHKFNVNVTVTNTECRTGHTEVTAATVCSIVVLACFGVVIATGTVYDGFFVRKRFSAKETHFVEENPKPSELASIDCQSSSKDCTTLPKEDLNTSSKTDQENKHIKIVLKVILAFSAISNGEKFLKIVESKQSIDSINGLRYLSIAWVIFGHTVDNVKGSSINELTTMKKFSEHWRYEAATNSFISVDTFFVLSGLLTSYLTLKEMKKKGWRINWAMFYFHRIWRLTPPYMLVLLTFLGLTQYFGEGALWPNQQPFQQENCAKKWWKNLLYINNFVGFERMCMAHSWYLANDMQFFILSPLMIIPFHLHRFAGVASCFVFLLSSWTATGVLSTVNGWTASRITGQMTFQERQDWERDFYVKPWCRIGPYVIGILAGFILSKIKGKSFQLKWWLVAFGWLISTITALLTVYGVHGDISGKHPSSTGVAALYNSVARSAWGVSISWIILACDAGYGGPVNAILSWSPFVVLGRLTYMMYLSHPFIINIIMGNLDMPFFMNDTSVSLYFISFLVFTSLTSFFFVLAFESPMIGLEKILLRKTHS